MSSKIEDAIDPIAAINKLESRLSYLRSKRKILIIAFIIGGVLGCVYAFLKKPLYQSHLTFSLDEGSSTSGSGITGIAAQFGISVPGTNSGMFSGDNIMEILPSRRIIESVLLSIDSFDNKPTTLIDHYLKINGLNKVDGNAMMFFPSSPFNRDNLSYTQDSILYETYFDISNADIKVAKPEENLSIFEVKFISRDEKFTKVFTDRLVKETIKFYTELKTKKNKETLDVLEQRVATLQDSLNKSISNKAVVTDANINPAFAVPQTPIQKQEFGIQVYSAAYAEIYKNLELERYQFLHNIPLLQVIDQADYPMEKVRSNKIVFFLLFGLLFVFISSITLLVLKRKTERRLRKQPDGQ